MSQVALVLAEIGHPLIPIQEPIPMPGEGEILVKVMSAGVNPWNQVTRDEGLFVGPNDLPLAMLHDVAGTVHAVGPGTNYTIGDRVFGQASLAGPGPGSREYSILQSDFTGPIPANTSYDEAASLSGNAIAAVVALFHETGLALAAPFENANNTQAASYKDATILINGAGSQIGKIAVQFARLAGFGTIIAVAGLGSKAQLRTFGATHVVDRNGADVVGAVREIAGDGLVYAVDTLSTGDGGHDLVARCMSDTQNAAFATLLPGTVSEKVQGNKKGVVDGRFVFGSSHDKPEFSKAFWKALPGWIERGEVLPLQIDGIIEGLDFAKLNEILDGYRDGKAVGKWYLHP